MAVIVPGIGYQQENIQTPVPTTDAGMIGARADVQGAGAGMRRVAQAGAELETVADKITRQEDQTAVLKAKNASSIDINKALIEFQSQMTGSVEQDQAAWDAAAAKIGQSHMAQLGNPVRQQAFAKDFDTLHRASTIQVQNLSVKNQMEQFKTATAGQLANLTKGAMAVVQAGPADYVSQVDAQFKAYEDVVNASPLLSQADKEANIQAAKQHFYLEVAKFQAETTPGAFSRDWRDGVWTKHLTPEAVVGLQSFSTSAETTNAVRSLQSKYPGNPAAAVREALSPEYGASRGYTIDQQNKVAAYFEGVLNFNYQQQQRAKAQASESAHTSLYEAIIRGDSAKAEAIALDPRTPESVKGVYANIVRNGGLDFKGNRALEVEASEKLFDGTISVEDVRGMVDKDGLSLKQANSIIDRFSKTSEEDKATFKDIRDEAKVSGEVPLTQLDNYMQYMRYISKKEGLKGQDLFFAAKKAREDTAAWYESNNAPYLKWVEGGGPTAPTPRRAAPAPMSGAGTPIIIRYDSNGKRIQE